MQKLILAIVAACLMGSLAAVAQTTPPKPPANQEPSAVEKEMAALGLTPAASGADVTVAYYSMALVNVDLKALDKIDDKSALATKDLGKLVVVMRNKANQQIWSAQSREFLDPDRTKLEGTISTVTARLFAAYPTRVQK